MTTTIQTAKISLVLPSHTLNALRAIAVQRQISLSDIVREAIRRMLEAQP
jgi:Arc/MetJ-type ribon-helix-helix transcriptional regulator